MIPNIDESWKPVTSLLYQEPLKTLFEEVLLNCSYQPKKENIFEIFKMPVKNIKVVILGQEPLLTKYGAVGKSFAVPKYAKIPRVLRIIQKELSDEYPLSVPYAGEDEWKTLEHWQEQGIFLLNTALTMETGKTGSHFKYWENFTKKVISYISMEQPCIWLLWGKKVQRFIPYINSNPFNVENYDNETIKSIPSNEDWNYILTAPHPNLEFYFEEKAEYFKKEKGFFGCNHFIYTNEILKVLKRKQINW